MEDQARKKLGGKKGMRDQEGIRIQMEEKLRDSLEWEKNLRRDRGKKRSKLEKMVGARSSR